MFCGTLLTMLTSFRKAWCVRGSRTVVGSSCADAERGWRSAPLEGGGENGFNKFIEFVGSGEFIARESF